MVTMNLWETVPGICGEIRKKGARFGYYGKAQHNGS